MSNRQRRLALATATVLSVGGAGLAAPAAAAGGTEIFVDKKASTCSDSGPGTQEQPKCTIQAGVDAADTPGQSVVVVPGNYTEQVTLTHSGASGLPITLRGDGQSGPVVRPPAGQSHVFVVSGVHDVAIQGFQTWGTSGETVLVSDSRRVLLDHLRLSIFGLNPAPAGVRLTGATAEVTVSRSMIDGAAGAGIAVDKGVTKTVLTTNLLKAGRRAGIEVADAPGTVITSNTVLDSGGTGIALLGDSSAATVENNVIAASDGTYAANPVTATELAVSPGSVPGTKADYNVVRPQSSGAMYDWGGSRYTSPAAFTGATGQGAHDLAVTPPFDLNGYSNARPLKAWAGTDSADATAPGQLDTDLDGNPRLDDLALTDTGTGVGWHDRGAVELPEFTTMDMRPDHATGPSPLPVTFTLTTGQNWPDAVTYTVDFGDGTEPAVTSDPKVTHTYTVKGTYTVKATARASHGGSISLTYTSITVNDPAPTVADLTMAPAPGLFTPGTPLDYLFTVDASSPWGIRRSIVDFGDGQVGYGSPVGHSYRQPGDYTVTLTVEDGSGAYTTTVRQLHVDYQAIGFDPVTPTRLLDTRQEPGKHLGPGQSVDIAIPAQPGGDVRPDAVVLNVTAVSPTSAGFLTVHPAGAPRPATSNVNFQAGTNVPNLVTVPTGDNRSVTVYNSSGTTDVVVDLVGQYRNGGVRYGAITPTRLLDTRTTKALGPAGTTTVKVRGTAGIPDDATAVVLNLTATAPDSPGFLTAYPTGTTRPGTSNLNFVPGQTVANQVIVPIGTDGTVTLYNHSGRTHTVVDAFGYYGPSGTALFTPVTPTRLLDTRTTKALGPGSTLKVPAGAPAGAVGAVLNLTSAASTANGYLTVWANGTARPLTSNVNFPAGKIVPNHVTTPLGTDGAFGIYNFSGTTQVVADLSGYFTE